MASSAVEQELLELEKKYWHAIKDKDADAAIHLSDDSCIVTGAQGVARINAEALARMMDAASYTLHDFTISEDQVRLPSDDVAIVAYNVHEHLTVEGNRSRSTRRTLRFGCVGTVAGFVRYIRNRFRAIPLVVIGALRNSHKPSMPTAAIETSSADRNNWSCTWRSPNGTVGRPVLEVTNIAPGFARNVSQDERGDQLRREDVFRRLGETSTRLPLERQAGRATCRLRWRRWS
jgi:hypothetical protein